MPTRPARTCTTPGCNNLTDTGRCDPCQTRRTRAKDQRRGTATERGYDWHWKARRLDYLLRHPWCALCPAVAAVADHYPDSRRTLVAAGVVDPDTDDRLRALCEPCHRRETARNQPGGWHRHHQPPTDGR